MIVGYMRNLKKPDSLARTTSLIAKSYGIELLYMNPADVDIKKKKVYGRLLVNNKWVDKETDIPLLSMSFRIALKRNRKKSWTS